MTPVYGAAWTGPARYGSGPRRNVRRRAMLLRRLRVVPGVRALVRVGQDRRRLGLGIVAAGRPLLGEKVVGALVASVVVAGAHAVGRTRQPASLVRHAPPARPSSWARVGRHLLQIRHLWQMRPAPLANATGVTYRTDRRGASEPVVDGGRGAPPGSDVHPPAGVGGPHRVPSASWRSGLGSLPCAGVGDKTAGSCREDWRSERSGGRIECAGVAGSSRHAAGPHGGVREASFPQAGTGSRRRSALHSAPRSGRPLARRSSSVSPPLVPR